MKGKIVYTTIIEKEIEVPDEVVAAFDKIATTWDADAYNLMDEFSDNVWKNVDNVENRLSIEFNQNGHWWVLEEY